MPTVLKIGGHQLEDTAFLKEMAAVIHAHQTRSSSSMAGVTPSAPYNTSWASSRNITKACA